jgi:hypothetical protein
MQVSQIVKENLIIDSKSYRNLSPVMKESVNDVFELIEKSTGNIIKKFENAVEKVSQHHNINIKELNNYFDNEIEEQLGEK